MKLFRRRKPITPPVTSPGEGIYLPAMPYVSPNIPPWTPLIAPYPPPPETGTRKPLPETTVLGYITGWREWALDNNFCLTSVNHSLWLPGEVLEAKCVHGTDPLECGCCGIYAYKTPDRIPKSAVFGGKVALWGEILECGEDGRVLGYRAQYAYPLSLVWPGCFFCLGEKKRASVALVTQGGGGPGAAVCDYHLDRLTGLSLTIGATWVYFIDEVLPHLAKQYGLILEDEKGNVITGGDSGNR